MSTTATSAFPEIDARTQDVITEQQAQFFRDNGLLLIRNVFTGAELEAVRKETQVLLDKAVASRVDEPDFLYQTHPKTGKEVPFRVEYVVDKGPACRALAAHPFVLRSVEVLQGRNFIPTWDSMVFKPAGQGTHVLWHRDAGDDGVLDKPIFNVDFYPDGASADTCVWGILGSNRWSNERIRERIAQLNDGGQFHLDSDCVPIPVNPGDVLFHDILVLHGSPSTQNAPQRRTIYYEYRPIETELAKGPHTPQYIPLKQKLLLATLRDRANMPYAQGEKPFQYQPDAKYAVTLGTDEKLPTYRIPHGQYWRKA